MHRLLNTIFLASFCLLTNNTQATTMISCKPVKLAVQGNNLILDSLDATTSKVYFLNNTTSQGIWIDHPLKERSASAGWSSYLQTGNWSALSVDRKGFAISCAAIKPGEVEYLNCSKVLSVCSPALKPSSNLKQQGTGWVAEDVKWDVLLKKVEKRGFHFN